MVLTLSATGVTSAEATVLIDADVQRIRELLGEQLVTEGRVALHDLVARLLIESGSTLAVAESITGGLLSERLVSVPGVSAVFLAGFVTYSNASKAGVLGVTEKTLRDHGAVSEECAREMAAGARRVVGADIGISTTGIAGPSGAVPGKPVGTVYLGLATADGVEAQQRQIIGDRDQIRARTAQWALDTLRLHLERM